MNTKANKNKNNNNKKNKKARIKNLGLPYANMMNSIVVESNGYQKSKTQGKSAAHFIDTINTINVSTVGTIVALCPIAQGVTVNQRTGDTVDWRSLHINYDVVTQNADIVNNTRVILFQWHVNTILAAPVMTDILQTVSVYSMYDWQFSNQYTILYDRVHLQSGIATAPASSGNQGYFGQIPFRKGCKLQGQFNPALNSGSHQFYLLVISDSLIAPFPLLNVTTRVVFSED